MIAPTDIEDELGAIVGSANLLCGGDIDDRYRTDIQNKYRSQPAYVVRPAETAQVAEIVRLAARHGIPITPLGGRTGVVGGGTCLEGAIILSLERMNRILELDEQSMTMTVEAGVILQTAHEAAEAAGLFLPLDLGARGSATIGGNIATNAGGNRVLRWGMMRDMVIGLEAVLADGAIVSSLTKALKDNAGYHWKHLLIGSEGTLGVVTRAVLRLRPLPTSAQTAIVCMAGFDSAPALLRTLDTWLSGQLSSFELMWDDFYTFVTGARSGPRPLPSGFPLYALVESQGSDSERDQALFQEVLAEAQEAGLIEDAVIGRSERERADLWAIRDDLTEAFRSLRPLTAFDVSLSLADMADFVRESKSALRTALPAATILYYGHAGDGNLHVVVSLDRNDHEAEAKAESAVYTCLRNFGGSISAEHGVGVAKRKFISFTRSPEELALMRSIKRALDPSNIMNPGKVLPDVD